ncbi:MAG: hypothetical protein ABR562_06680 [Thermoplasmatota archaeon]
MNRFWTGFFTGAVVMGGVAAVAAIRASGFWGGWIFRLVMPLVLLLVLLLFGFLVYVLRGRIPE